MRFNYLTNELGGLGVATFLGWLRRTLDVQVAHYDVTSDPSRPEFCGRMILVFWHEYIVLPLSHLGKCNIAFLTSRHHDADWLARAGLHLGYRVVRGSTNRGGAEALRELKRTGENRNLSITPDGPVGPRRGMSLGPVYLSSRLGIPLVPLGVGYDRPLRLKTWDCFAVPRPYSRTRFVWGPRVQVPRAANREQLEFHRLKVEGIINSLTTEAEEWAASGSRRVGQVPFSCSRDKRRFDRDSPFAAPHYAQLRLAATSEAEIRLAHMDFVESATSDFDLCALHQPDALVKGLW